MSALGCWLAVSSFISSCTEQSVPLRHSYFRLNKRKWKGTVNKWVRWSSVDFQDGWKDIFIAFVRRKWRWRWRTYGAMLQTVKNEDLNVAITYCQTPRFITVKIKMKMCATELEKSHIWKLKPISLIRITYVETWWLNFIIHWAQQWFSDWAPHTTREKNRDRKHGRETKRRIDSIRVRFPLVSVCVCVSVTPPPAWLSTISPSSSRRAAKGQTLVCVVWLHSDTTRPQVSSIQRTDFLMQPKPSSLRCHTAVTIHTGHLLIWQTLRVCVDVSVSVWHRLLLWTNFWTLFTVSWPLTLRQIPS